LVKGVFPHARFTAGISGEGCAETPDPTVDVVRTGESRHVHQAGWFAPSGGACRVDHVTGLLRRGRLGNGRPGPWPGT